MNIDEVDEETCTPGSLDGFFSDGESRATTFNLSGGVGGAGGNGLLTGGVGGNAEAPRLYMTNAERFTVNLNSGEQALICGNYRKIPWGDIYLQHQLSVRYPEPQQYHWKWPRHSVRKLRSAKINGTQNVTVVTFEGNRAEQAWKEEVKMYMKIRHENILQMYGVVQGQNLYAIVFHDDFILFSDLVTKLWKSPLLTVCIQLYFSREHNEAIDHLISRFRAHVFFDYDVLVCYSTGRLCIDIGGHSSTNTRRLNHFQRHSPKMPTMNVFTSAATSLVMQALTLDDYHNICNSDRLRRSKSLVFSSSAAIHLDSVYCAAAIDTFGNSIEIATVMESDTDFNWPPCWRETWAATVGGQKLYAGWGMRLEKCFSSSELLLDHTYFQFEAWQIAPISRVTWYGWLSQANHIFSHLRIESNFSNYVLLDRFELTISLKPNPNNAGCPPQGYLWLRSKDVFLASHSFECPQSLAYWSLDLDGTRELSTEHAVELGFPILCMEKIKAHGQSWDDSVYTGLRELHQGKGFDPDSQDVARHLGYRLYKPCSDADMSIVGGEIKESYDGEDDFWAVSEENVNGSMSNEHSSNSGSEQKVAKPSNLVKGPTWNVVHEGRVELRDFELHESLHEFADQMPASKAFKVVTTVQLLLIGILAALVLLDNV
ncbi:hypothetical protein R3P38DRAFT_3070868 [Favolaschia claudopus]|uniref:Serine-threonine/tyrosine-protein kinase catalytic domain-containing protein n=1 Tax=Favolaschia claudopus TaxID=2862362 RepID=A0AAV9ZZR1_9AGAR